MAPQRVGFRLLGPLEVTVDGREIKIGSRKQRMLLCALAAEPHRVVPVDALVGLLWASSPPRSVDVTLRGLVSRLRRELGRAGDRLVAHNGGYLLRATPSEVDTEQFTRLAARGREDLAAGSPEQAVGALRDALALWRGVPPMAEIADSELGRPAVARLEDARITAVEELAEAELAADRPEAAVHVLGPHVISYPLRERAWEALMLAQYRLGRQADALASYRAVRRILNDELGVEPNPALRRLENRILMQDPALDLDAAGASESARHNLPAALNPLVGRGKELAALSAELSGTRLLTLTGVGGAGKTRLALQLAAEQLDRWDAVRLVELAPLEAADRVAREVAQQLGVAGAGHGELLSRLAEHLRGRRVLLVLDNCEHLLDEAARIAAVLLRGSPGLTVLTTSRQPLGVTGEVIWPVPPLSLPPVESSTPAGLSGSDAVTLFCQRARAVQVGFGLTAENAAAIGSICRRLDGIPLALELAAARLRVLPAEQVAARLDDRFALLSAGARTAPPRQQTLRATMDWSYQLLTVEEQAGLRALTVFPADFDLSAAMAVVAPVCGGLAEDLVFRLVDKSLVVVRRREGETRYGLLETVRGYGAERLADAGELDAARRRHREHYRRVAAGWRDSRFVTAAWSRRVAIEEENMRVAVVSALDDGDGDAARQLLSGLWPYWTWTGRTEAAEWLEQALVLDGADLRTRAEVAMGLSLLLTLWELGPAERAAELIASAMALAEQANDDGCRSWAHFFHGELLSFCGDRAKARVAYRTALRLVQQPGRAAAFHHSLGWVAMAEDDPAGARAEFEQAVTYGVEGDVHVAHAQAALALLLAATGETGETDRATALAGEAVAAARRFRLPGVLVMALVRAAQTLLRCGHETEAHEALRELFTLLHRLGTRPFRAEALDAAAVLAHRTGDHRRAAWCLGASQAVRLARGEDHGIDVLGPQLAAVHADGMTMLGAGAVAEIIDAASRRPLAEAVAETRTWLESASGGG